MHVTVVGGGLTGALAALYLASRGYVVDVYEARADPRHATAAAAASPSALRDAALRKAADASRRSINLALSTRGLRALGRVGLAERALEMAVPMHGRVIHDKRGKLELQPYGAAAHEVLYSVSRVGMNIMLLDELEQRRNVRLHFGCKCVALREDGSATFEKAAGGVVEVEAGRLLGCDGAFSAVRALMGRVTRLSVSLEYIDSGYKELAMPPGKDGKHAMPPHGLHIWPSGELMLIALPNNDGSFTCTLFGPFRTLESVRTAEEVLRFFETHFPDAVGLMPDLTSDYINNPIGALSTVRCSPWNFNQMLLLGDAAHGVVPFYGQGMNCGFEDCIELDDALEETGHDWAAALPMFAAERKQATDALAELALDNYVEMRDKTVDRLFLLKCRVHALLHALLGSSRWQPSLHTAVSFTTMPYHVARSVCERQDRILARAALVGVGLVASAALWVARRPSLR